MSMVKRAGLISLGVAHVFGLADCGSEEEEVTLTPQQEEAVSERLAPAGEVTLESDVVQTAPAVDKAASAEPRSGEEVYNASCTTCHAVGAAGAPKLGTVADWEERLAKGADRKRLARLHRDFHHLYLATGLAQLVDHVVFFAH